MATVPSRLKQIVREHEFRSYEQLYSYVMDHCGPRMRNGVIDYRFDLERYINAKDLANKSCGMQTGTERTTRSKRGLSGCSMVIERR